MTNPHTITQERAARRYAQIVVLERQLGVKLAEIARWKTAIKDLREEADALLARIRVAARDQGELPLFDLDEP
jgi:hypothetical protein